MSTLAKLSAETHQQFHTDVEYFNSHWNDLRDAYPNCHVAVYHGRVAAADPKLKGVLKELDNQGIPRNTVLIRFIADPPKRMIL